MFPLGEGRHGRFSKVRVVLCVPRLFPTLGRGTVSRYVGYVSTIEVGVTLREHGPVVGPSPL